MSAIFRWKDSHWQTLSTATPRPSYARALNGKHHPAIHVIEIDADDYLTLSEIDWNL